VNSRPANTAQLVRIQMEVTLASALPTGLVETAQLMLMNVHQVLAYTEHVTIQTETSLAFVNTDGQVTTATLTSTNATLHIALMGVLVVIMTADFFANAILVGAGICVKLISMNAHLTITFHA